MRAVASVVVGLLAMAGLASPAQATQSVAKKYSSCADLLDKYPNGVAKNKKSRTQAVKGDFAKPKVSKSLYKENGARLDRDKDGVMCEQEVVSSEVAECTLDDTASLRGWWAYVKRMRSKRACGEWNEGQYNWARNVSRALRIHIGFGTYSADPRVLETQVDLLAQPSRLSRFGLDASYTPWALEEQDTMLEVKCPQGIRPAPPTFSSVIE